MSNRTRFIQYITVGFFAGVALDLIGIYIEEIFKHEDPLLFFSMLDYADFISTLFVGCLAAFGALLLAGKDNSLISLLEKIKSHNKDLNTILEKSPLAKIVVSPELVVLYHNDQATVFHPIGMACGVLFPVVQEWRQGGGEFSIKIEERETWHRFFETPVQWHGMDAILVSIEDITSDKEIERIRVDVDRIIHHDIRSPLCGIIGLANMLLEKDLDNTDEYIQGIKESAEMVCSLVDQVSLIYKLEGGQWECPLQPVNLLDSITGVVRRLQVSADANKVSLAVVPPQKEAAQSCICYGNQLLLSMLIENILKNAMEAAHSGEAVTAKVSLEEGQLCLEVSNPGSIPNEIRDRFFDKYVTHGKSNGTGLGTYLCKLIASALHGSISVTQDDYPPTVSVSVRIPLATI